MKRSLLVLLLVGMFALQGLACERPDDPDMDDPDNPVCELCCGFGCEECEGTGSPILAEEIRADREEGEQE